MTKKFTIEDVGAQKYTIRNFRKFQMIEDRDVSSQIHDYHMLINDIVTEDIRLPEPFVVTPPTRHRLSSEGSFFFFPTYIL